MDIKSIIKEEVNKFINEVHDYGDDEIINNNEIDLQHEYDKLNQQLFNNELPRVPLKWGDRKRALGHVKSMFNKITGEIKIMNLVMSGFYAMPYHIFKNTLAHEMIHVKQLNGGERGSHGYSFMKEADRINNMGLGYDITQFNTDELKVSNKTRENARQMIGIILDIDGKYFLAVTTPSTYNIESDNLFNLFEKLVKVRRYNSVEITIVETTNSELLKFPIQRNFRRSISYGKLSDELFNQLLDDKIIKTVKIGQTATKQMSEENNLTDNAGDWEEIIII